MITIKDILENLKQYNLNTDDMNIMRAGFKKLLPDLQEEEQKLTDKVKKDYEQKLANIKDGIIKNQAKKIANIFAIELEDSVKNTNDVSIKNEAKVDEEQQT